MKFLVVFLCLAAAAYGFDKEKAAEVKKKVAEWAISCESEVGATKDDMMELMKEQVPASHEGKCLLFCIHKKMQTQDEAGNLVKGKGAEIMSMDLPKQAFGEEWVAKAVTVANKCDNTVVQDADPCITAANMHECCIKERQAVGLDFNEM